MKLHELPLNGLEGSDRLPDDAETVPNHSYGLGVNVEVLCIEFLISLAGARNAGLHQHDSAVGKNRAHRGDDLHAVQVDTLLLFDECMRHARQCDNRVPLVLPVVSLVTSRCH